MIDGTKLVEQDCHVSIRRHVRSELPFLRRFGRALTGNQQLADLCVVQLLDDLVDSPTLMQTAHNSKAALYKHLLAMLNSFANAAAEGESPAFLSPLSRQAQLLTSVEGFTREEVGEILGLTEDRVALLLLESAKQNSWAGSATVLVIEDEPLISMQLERLIDDLGHTLLGIATTHTQATRLGRNRVPDLILSDVQLADGSSGIDAVRDILSLRQVPVIYITAYPERLLTGRRAEPNFLISKPFDAEAVKVTIGQALFLELQSREHGAPRPCCKGLVE